jgi:hypothetical protein
VEKRCYSAASLEEAVREFERGYGLSSDDFYRSYRARDADRVAPRHRLVWASFRRNSNRMKGNSGEDDSGRVRFAERVARELDSA